MGLELRTTARMGIALAACGAMIALPGSHAADTAKQPSCFGKKATIVGPNTLETRHERGGKINTIFGTKKSDVIVGTNGKDHVFGYGGGDRICTKGARMTSRATRRRAVRSAASGPATTASTAVAVTT